MKQTGAMMLVAVAVVFVWAWPAYSMHMSLSDEELDLVMGCTAQTPEGPFTSEPPAPSPPTVIASRGSSQDTTNLCQPGGLVLGAAISTFTSQSNSPSYFSNIPASRSIGRPN